MFKYIDCSEMKENDKWLFCDHFRPFFGHLYDYTSNNWGSDNHFEVLNRSKPWLNQKLWLKMQIFPSPFSCYTIEKDTFTSCIYGFVRVLCHNCCTNHDSDLFSASKWVSETQFCEIFSYRCYKIGQKWSWNGHLSDSNLMINLWFSQDLSWPPGTFCVVYFEPIKILTH